MISLNLNEKEVNEFVRFCRGKITGCVVPNLKLEIVLQKEASRISFFLPEEEENVLEKYVKKEEVIHLVRHIFAEGITEGVRVALEQEKENSFK